MSLFGELRFLAGLRGLAFEYFVFKARKDLGGENHFAAMHQRTTD
jgi:hypothetical protein